MLRVRVFQRRDIGLMVFRDRTVWFFGLLDFGFSGFWVCFLKDTVGFQDSDFGVFRV
jgi:hypothetical protein